MEPNKTSNNTTNRFQLHCDDNEGFSEIYRFFLSIAIEDPVLMESNVQMQLEGIHRRVNQNTDWFRDEPPTASKSGLQRPRDPSKS